MPSCPEGYVLYEAPPSGFQIEGTIYDNTVSYDISQSGDNTWSVFEGDVYIKDPVSYGYQVFIHSATKIFREDYRDRYPTMGPITHTITPAQDGFDVTVTYWDGNVETYYCLSSTIPIVTITYWVKGSDHYYIYPISSLAFTTIRANGIRAFRSDMEAHIDTKFRKAEFMFRAAALTNGVERYNYQTSFQSLSWVPLLLFQFNGYVAVYTRNGWYWDYLSQATLDNSTYSTQYLGLSVSWGQLLPPGVTVRNEFTFSTLVTFDDGRTHLFEGSPNDILPYRKKTCYKCQPPDPPDRGDDHCPTCPPRSDPTGSPDETGCVNIQTSSSVFYYWTDSYSQQIFFFPEYEGHTPVGGTSVQGTFWPEGDTKYQLQGYTFYSDTRGRGVSTWQGFSGPGEPIPNQDMNFSNHSNRPGYGNYGNQVFTGNNNYISQGVTWYGTYTQHMYGILSIQSISNSCPGVQPPIIPFPTPTGYQTWEPPTSAPVTPPPPPPPKCRQVLWLATLLRFNIEAGIEAVLDYIPLPGLSTPKILTPPDVPYKALFDFLGTVFSGGEITADQVRDLYDLLLQTLTLVLPPKIREVVQLLLTFCTPEPLHNIMGTECGELILIDAGAQTFLKSDTSAKLISSDARLMFVILNQGYL